MVKMPAEKRAMITLRPHADAVGDAVRHRGGRASSSTARTCILLLMCIELLLLAANFNFVAFSRYLGNIDGQVFVFFVLTVAAAESAIGLAILVVLFRERRSINVEDLEYAEGLERDLNPNLLLADPAAAAAAADHRRPVRPRSSAAPARALRHHPAAWRRRCVLSLHGAASSCCSTARRRTTAPSTPGWSATASRMQVGFLVDRLTALMMVVVTFVSLCVHVYTIGYMHDDPGYQRFFSYISLFTFSMLMLVMSNNFLQLFFGWEAVGVVSYLLIGFWYTRPTRDLRQPEGLPGQPRRRLRLPARHRRRRCTTPARSTTATPSPRRRQIAAQDAAAIPGSRRGRR